MNILATLKKPPIKKIILIFTPLLIFFILPQEVNSSLQIFLSYMGTISGIISYYISIILLDSTNKIKEKIFDHDYGLLQLQSNINNLKQNMASVHNLLSNYISIIDELELDIKFGRDIKEETLIKYEKTKISLVNVLTDYQVSIQKYSGSNFDFTKYLSDINRTRVDLVKRNLPNTLQELKRQTTILKNIIGIIPKLDERNKEI